MTFVERARRLENRLYAAIRHPGASEVAGAEPANGMLEPLDGRRHCLLVSYRRSGDPVATPVWFALDGDRLVFESDADSAKVRRIRRDPRVRVAPCTLRGNPLGPPVEGVARVLEPAEAEAAERALDRKYGRLRRLLTRMRPVPPAGLAYLEVVPAGA
jgi:PPOX class probable F420-dependent enzyme